MSPAHGGELAQNIAAPYINGKVHTPQQAAAAEAWNPALSLPRPPTCCGQEPLASRWGR